MRDQKDGRRGSCKKGVMLWEEKENEIKRREGWKKRRNEERKYEIERVE